MIHYNYHLSIILETKIGINIFQSNYIIPLGVDAEDITLGFRLLIWWLNLLVSSFVESCITFNLPRGGVSAGEYGKLINYQGGCFIVPISRGENFRWEVNYYREWNFRWEVNYNRSGIISNFTIFYLNSTLGMDQKSCDKFQSNPVNRFLSVILCSTSNSDDNLLLLEETELTLDIDVVSSS